MVIIQHYLAFHFMFHNCQTPYDITFGNSLSLSLCLVWQSTFVMGMLLEVEMIQWIDQFKFVSPCTVCCSYFFVNFLFVTIVELMLNLVERYTKISPVLHPRNYVNISYSLCFCSLSLLLSQILVHSLIQSFTLCLSVPQQRIKTLSAFLHHKQYFSLQYQ